MYVGGLPCAAAHLEPVLAIVGEVLACGGDAEFQGKCLWQNERRGVRRMGTLFCLSTTIWAPFNRFMRNACFKMAGAASGSISDVVSSYIESEKSEMV